MIKNLFFLILLTYCNSWGQIANYNHFPTLKPSHILDENKTAISFAFSMRLLESDYEGPLIRLRRNNDNAIRDFNCSDNDIVDIDAINTWRAGNDVFVVTWYDQSGLGRNAEENNINRQPQFIAIDPLRPYLVGDGINDRLIINTSIQLLTETGKNGSVFGVFLATDRADSAFGVISNTNNRDRWLTHINWSDERCYFDAGSCCQNGRFFTNNLPSDPVNPGSLNIWDQYSFIRRNNPLNSNIDRRIIRSSNVERTNTGYPDNLRCSVNFNFGICAIVAGATNNTASHSNTRIQELVMYNNGKEDNFINEIEQNQIDFWNL